MKVSMQHFSASCDNKTFVTEMSDFGPEFRFQPLRGVEQLGLTLVSDFSNEADFMLVRTERSNDEDNEVLAWHLEPTPETLKHVPRLQGFTMTIFND